jgi:hypothetical protein
MKTRGKMVRAGGRRSACFGVYFGELLLGEVRRETGGWIAYLAELSGDLIRLPGSYDSAGDAREVIVDANCPDE